MAALATKLLHLRGGVDLAAATARLGAAAPAGERLACARPGFGPVKGRGDDCAADPRTALASAGELAM